jgi:hypothetical protein
MNLMALFLSILPVSSSTFPLLPEDPDYNNEWTPSIEDIDSDQAAKSGGSESTDQSIIIAVVRETSLAYKKSSIISIDWDRIFRLQVHAKAKCF